MSDKYLIVSPCRNEEQFMRQTLESIVNQSVLPSLWVIVDDGSTDATPAILKEYAEKYHFIKIVTRENRGHRSVGPGVIEAFYYGLATVDVNQFNFVCKLDLDLNIPPRYFEIILNKMKANSRLGTCSGKAYFYNKSGEMVSECIGDENSLGMIKFYRRECFEEIGGFVRQVMWDGIDGHRCRQLGWIAASWDEPDLRFIHLRPMGASDKGIITGRIRHGFGQYFMGTGFVFMLASGVYRLTKRPFVIGGLAMLWGYLKSWLMQVPRFEDTELIKFINKYQWSCLFKGKRQATADLNARQEKIWLNRYSKN